MYIKFKVGDGGYANGGHGLMGAIDWAMTANAASTATSSDFTGSFSNEISDFKVIANDEAGGWTNFDAISSASSSHNWSAGWEADSPKTGRSFKKRFSVSSNTTQAGYYGHWSPKGGLYDNDASSYLRALTSLSYSTITTNSVARHTWFSNLQPAQFTWGWWNLSVTSKYVYFWPDTNSSSQSGTKYFAGVADLAGTPDYLLSAISDNFNSVGFYVGGSNDTGSLGTSTSASFMNDYIHYYFAGIDGGFSSTASATNAMLTQSGALPSINATAIPWQMHPPHYYNVVDQTYEHHLPIFNDYGSAVGALHPITIMSPLRGVPATQLEGIYYYGIQTNANVTRNLEWSNRGAHAHDGRTVYDSNGDKYVLYHSYGSMHIKAIRAM
jgi:hypothetical protein